MAIKHWLWHWAELCNGKSSVAGSLINCSKQVTNAWSWQRRAVPHAVLWWNVCKPCAVLFHCFQYPCLRIHRFQRAVAGAISPLSPDGCKTDVCVGVSHFSFLESWCRRIGDSEAQHISEHISAKGWQWKWKVKVKISKPYAFPASIIWQKLEKHKV